MEFVALAKEVGITLAKEDSMSSNDNELSDDDLKAVTGGGSDYRECHCPVYGQSTGCGCFLVGISVTG